MNAIWYDGIKCRHEAEVKFAKLWTEDLATESNCIVSHDMTADVWRYMQGRVSTDRQLKVHFNPTSGTCFLSRDTVGYCDGNIDLRYAMII